MKKKFQLSKGTTALIDHLRTQYKDLTGQEPLERPDMIGQRVTGGTSDEKIAYAITAEKGLLAVVFQDRAFKGIQTGPTFTGFLGNKNVLTEEQKSIVSDELKDRLRGCGLIAK